MNKNYQNLIFNNIQKDKLIILPSVLACNFLKLGDDLNKTKEADIRMLHFDVMDGHFVKNISFGESIFSFFKESFEYFDIHLMVTNPFEHIQNFYHQGGRMFSLHVELFENEEEIAAYVRSIREFAEDIYLGLVINPSNNNEALFLSSIHLFDYCLIMTVEPGLGGQKFNDNMTGRIKRVSDYIKRNNLNIFIEVDGGIDEKTALLAKKNGATMFVAGSYLYKDNAIYLKERCELLKKEFNK